MVDSTVFIGAVIIGVTQALKFLAPNVRGIVTVVVAMITGAIVALLDTQIGIGDINVATGVLIGLGSVGTVTTASKLGNGSSIPPKV